MAQIKEIILTINGQEVKGKEGDTVLDVCRANDIYVPTLCYLEGLPAVGACRLCVVEIEGERRLNPACTYPARDGLVIRTDTENLEKYRRQMLELLFTERNHFCFFCASSGDCELQKLAYQYQMDHARYPYTFPVLPTDTLNDFLVIDHNRCILCGRCVRTCADVVGSHTIDFGRRGWRTVITSDLNQPLGESSCISCGACVQACPTGAIFSKASAYRGRTTEGKTVRSLCSLCGVGCEIDVLVKDNNIIRIDGANVTGAKGPLCLKGRFEQLYRETPRIYTPVIVDREGGRRTSSWEEAFDSAIKGLSAYRRHYGASSIAGLVSSLCPNETLEAFNQLMRDSVGTELVDTLDGSTYRTVIQGISTYSGNGLGLEIESPLESILEADCMLVVGASPLESHPVAGCYMLRARAQNQAQLLVIDPQHNDLGVRADLWLRPASDGIDDIIRALAAIVVEKKKPAKQPQAAILLARAMQSSGLDEASLTHAADLLNSARKVAVVYGDGIFSKQDPSLVACLLKLAQLANPNGPRVISLKPRGNSRGAWALGIASREIMMKDPPKVVYMLLADEEPAVDDPLFRVAEQAEFLIVQASYQSPLTIAANVVFPSPIWAEREGTYLSLDGTAGKSQRLLEPPTGLKDDLEIITRLAQRLKKRRLMRWPK